MRNAPEKHPTAAESGRVEQPDGTTACLRAAVGPTRLGGRMRGRTAPRRDVRESGSPAAASYVAADPALHRPAVEHHRDLAAEMRPSPGPAGALVLVILK